MRLKLRLLALAIALAGLVFWFFGGMHTGWTKTTVQTMHKDPVTDIEFPVTEKRFVAGVDFLAASGGLALLLAGASFLLPARK